MISITTFSVFSCKLDFSTRSKNSSHGQQADERAVLKHFDWPEKKADAMREASVEYRSLKLLEDEISSFEDDNDVPCGSAMKKMANLLDK